MTCSKYDSIKSRVKSTENRYYSKAMPDVRTIQKLAQVFNVSVEELMNGASEFGSKTKKLIMLILRCVAFEK